MSKILDTNQSAHLRQEIISQCTWSETYSSLKYILKRTAYQLPLLISFLNNNDDEQTTNKNYQTIFFFDRNSTNKILLTPLQQNEEQRDQFDVYPNHCTFVMTDLFKGLFEFVRNGQRCGQVYPNLEQLIHFTTSVNCSVVFMSRDRTLAFIQDVNSSQWSNKEYPQGAIFRGERIHRSSVSTNDNRQIANDYLECRDEDGYTVFIKMAQTGRFSVIATSMEQQEHQPEIYLHSTQTSNIDQLIKRVIPDDNNNKNKNNCIRLVRGPVPHNFYCQYFRFVRQRTHDVLVGLTQEGLVIEWNLESHVPCRYATNLNEILDNIYGTILDQTLQSYIEQSRIHHRDSFQQSMQLISSQDWTGFFQYWKWTGDVHQKSDEENKISYQSRHRFHLVASLLDLSDQSQSLVSAFRESRNLSPISFTSKENKPIRNKKTFSAKQRSFLSQMSKLISSPSNPRKHHSERLVPQARRASALILPNGTKPFDNSIYDSNQFHQSSTQIGLDNRPTQKPKRT